MNDLCVAQHGANHVLQLSKGWLSGFCRRYNISNQMRTEKKFKSAVERMHVIDQFHRDVWYLQTTLPQMCPIWGAFPRENIWNADHIISAAVHS